MTPDEDRMDDTFEREVREWMHGYRDAALGDATLRELMAEVEARVKEVLGMRPLAVAPGAEADDGDSE